MEEKITKGKKGTQAEVEEPMFNPLKNERVIIKHVPKESALIHNPKHINYGGMSEEASRWFTVPLLRSGQMADPLTKEEKAFLEEIMGLENNALSIYRKKDNYWSNFFVRLYKQDNYLDLSVPEDYIKYRVLLLNKDFIAPSLDELQTKPKATYEFVILHEQEEAKANKKRVNSTVAAYKEFGKIESDTHKMRVILETASGKPMGVKTSPDILSDRIDKLIKADARLFLRIVEDPMLDTKVLLKRGIEVGAVILRNGLLHDTEGKPLCDSGDATLSVAAAYINKPANQALKMAIEAKIADADKQD
jgi:hypothetical protein